MVMSRASEVSKIEVYLNAYRKTWTKSSSLILMMLACHKKSYLICDKITKLRISEILCNIFLSSCLCPVLAFSVQKKIRIGCVQFFLFHTKKFPWFSHWKTSLNFFFWETIYTIMTIYNVLLLRPCLLAVSQTSQNRFGFFINLARSF